METTIVARHFNRCPMGKKRKKTIKTKGEEMLYALGQGERLRYIVKEKKGWDAYTTAMQFFGFQINEILKISTRKDDTLTIKFARRTPKYDPQIGLEIKRLCKAHGGEEVNENQFKFQDSQELDKLLNTEQNYIKDDFEDDYLSVIRRRVYDHFYKKTFNHEGVLDQYTGFITSLGGNMSWVRRGGPVENAFKDEIQEKIKEHENAFKKEKESLVKKYDAKLTALKNKFYDRLEKKDQKIDRLER